MLTNIKKPVLLVLILFIFTSCWTTWVKDIEDKIKVEVIENSGEWKKGDSIWKEVIINNNIETIIYNWKTEYPKWSPNILNNN